MKFLFSVFFLFLTPSGEHKPHELNHSDALQNKIHSRCESSKQTSKDRLSIEQGIDKDKDANKVTYINYYISSVNKENQQSCVSKIFQLFKQQAINIFYGILGSFVASALSGAIYSIANTATGEDEIVLGNNFTTTAIKHNANNSISFNGN